MTCKIYKAPSRPSQTCGSYSSLHSSCARCCRREDAVASRLFSLIDFDRTDNYRRLFPYPGVFSTTVVDVDCMTASESLRRSPHHRLLHPFPRPYWSRGQLNARRRFHRFERQNASRRTRLRARRETPTAPARFLCDSSQRLVTHFVRMWRLSETIGRPEELCEDD